MNLFDQLVAEALRTRADFAPLRPVVEKELLHHDILREMSAAGLLEELTFIGGTCLRVCHGSPRLSEDLDFTGGPSFQPDSLAKLARVLPDRIGTRYGLPVRISEPSLVSDTRVSTWKLIIETRPAQRHLPAQRIHLDICAIPSHDPVPMVPRQPYGIDQGTSGLILQVQSRGEILADKIIALALRANRLKNRDLWDIAWLVQQGIVLPATLIPRKIQDHQRDPAEFADLLTFRTTSLAVDPKVRAAFLHEMRRFLPAATVRDSLESPAWWTYLTQIITEQTNLALNAIR